MPTEPRKRATAAAMPSMMRVKEVRPMESATSSSRVATRATGRFGFTDQTASRTPGRSAAGSPSRTRTAYARDRWDRSSCPWKSAWTWGQ